MQTKKTSKFVSFMILIVFLTGLSLLFYPTFMDFYHKLSNYKTIQLYQQEMNATTKMNHQQMLEKALVYNTTLGGEVRDLTEYPEILEQYNEALDFGGGMIGYIEINKINVLLPIYHGVGEEVLNRGVGHVAGTYLPTGELGNHTVLTAHTGLPSAKLFTNLDQLVEGDTFSITVLDDTYYYQVRNVETVLPEDARFQTDSEKDLVTLFTCTPYGVNTHRLLVEAEQIERSVEFVENEYAQQQQEIYAFTTGALIGVLVGVLFGIIIGIGFAILIGRLVAKNDKK